MVQFLHMEKKEKSMWFLATTHLFTAFFAIPIIGGWILNILLYMTLSSLLGGVGYYVMSSVLGFVLVLLGVYHSHIYLTKRYIINDPQTLVTRATIYAVIIGLLFLGGMYLLPETDPAAFALQGGYFGLLMAPVFGAIQIAIFYYASKRAFGVK